jgi:DNA mismatch repair ATPase MutS
MQRPLIDSAVLRGRQDAVAFVMQPSQQDLIAELRSHLRHIRDPARIIARLRVFAATATDWKAIHDVRTTE